MHNPKYFTGPQGIPVSDMTKQQLQLEICELYSLISPLKDILGSGSLRDLADAIDNINQHLES